MVCPRSYTCRTMRPQPVCNRPCAWLTVKGCLNCRLDCGATMDNTGFFEKQADRIRLIADNADPFTKRRLLPLARTYDGWKPAPRPLPLRPQHVSVARSAQHSERG